MKKNREENYPAKIKKLSEELRVAKDMNRLLQDKFQKTTVPKSVAEDEEPDQLIQQVLRLEK